MKYFKGGNVRFSLIADPAPRLVQEPTLPTSRYANQN